VGAVVGDGLGSAGALAVGDGASVAGFVALAVSSAATGVCPEATGVASDAEQADNANASVANATTRLHFRSKARWAEAWL
jgi:hypothetical protein